MFDGDPVRLAQVFTNLITNALKYSPEDRPIVVTVNSNPGQLEIAVADQGLGISEPDQDRLFAPFFRSTNPEALRRNGTGLGLIHVKSIVEEHGGTLRLSSKLGAGSTFTVELPLRMDVQEALSA
jgi:signal transduction histidine kinase